MKHGRFFGSVCAGLLSLMLAAGNCGGIFTALAADGEDGVSELTLAAMEDDYFSFEPADPDLLTYSDYYDLYSGMGRPHGSVTVPGSSYLSADGDITVGTYTADGVSHSNSLVWESEGGSVTYSFDIPETGLYCVEMTYCAMKSSSAAVELDVKIDGETPYDTASRITLGRVWVNERAIYKDSRGDQIRPAQVQKEMWQTVSFGDTDGIFSEPLFFYLENGRHDITFTSERARLAIASFRLYAPEELPTYSEYAASVKASASIEGTPDRKFRIEAENADFKSDPTLYPTYDNTTYLMSPSDPRKVVYNSLGGANWKNALQSVTWVIPRETIGNSGWYRIGIKYRQDQMRGLFSNRRIYIDGKVPCADLDSVSFSYGRDWKLKELETDGGEELYVYLDASSDHTFTMEAVPGEIGNSMRRLDPVIADLNTYYRRILMITGPAPDKYTDYYVHERIPELVDEFDRLADELEDIQDGIEDLSGTAGSEAAALGRMAVILRKCVKKPLKIPDYLPQIKENLTSISAWMLEYRGQPLEVDFIEFASQDENFPSCKKKFTKSVKYGFSAFIGSFLDDYTTISDVSGKDAIDVWVSLGRDQALVVKELTQNQFIQESGIPVAVNLVTGGIIEASLAGKGPDVALFVGGEFPVNLAARGLLTDISQFSDYNEVAGRFQKNAMTPYSYNGGVYGLPISQTFPMLFYRTDVLSELGFDRPPETWQNFMDMLPAIQRNYMSAGLILPSANISPATEAGHTFAMLLLQKGIGYYNGDLSATTFGSAEAVQCFEQWTDFYTKYSFEQTYDAFNRFRTGEYPMLIANYTFANQLNAASPEIKGLWDFCPVPGTVRADGTVSHAVNSNGSGAVIFNKISSKENGWEFIKWFTGTEIQVQYGTQIEGLLGGLGRFDTANVEALGQLSWSDSELKRLRAQQDELEEIPILPASYAVTRNIMNAFRETVNSMKNPRDTLLRYDRDINDEIERKRKNLG